MSRAASSSDEHGYVGTDGGAAQLAARLEQDDYPNAFEGLKDWHLLRAIAFERPDMVEPYLYLLDMEAFDEA